MYISRRPYFLLFLIISSFPFLFFSSLAFTIHICGDCFFFYANSFRFVLDACKRLREKKSYLMYTAVGCLGAAALGDLVMEVSRTFLVYSVMVKDSY